MRRQPLSDTGEDFPSRVRFPEDTDEISLFEVWETLRRGRWIVFSMLLAAVFFAAGYTAFHEPRYEMTALVEIGQSAGPGEQLRPLEASELVATRLAQVIIPRVREAQSESRDGLPGIDVSAVDGNGGLIRLAAEVQASEVARMTRLMSSAVEALRERHEAIQADRLSWLERSIDNLEDRRQVLELTTSLPTGGIGANSIVDGAPGAAQTLLDAVSLSLRQHRRQQRWQLEDRVAELESMRSQSTPTVMLRAPGLSPGAVSAGGGTILAIGAVIGLVLGVFGAFIGDFLHRARSWRENNEDV